MGHRLYIVDYFFNPLNCELLDVADISYESVMDSIKNYLKDDDKIRRSDIYYLDDEGNKQPISNVAGLKQLLNNRNVNIYIMPNIQRLFNDMYDLLSGTISEMYKIINKDFNISAIYSKITGKDRECGECWTNKSKSWLKCKKCNKSLCPNCLTKHEHDEFVKDI